MFQGDIRPLTTMRNNDRWSYAFRRWACESWKSGEGQRPGKNQHWSLRDHPGREERREEKGRAKEKTLGYRYLRRWRGFGVRRGNWKELVREKGEERRAVWVGSQQEQGSKNSQEQGRGLCCQEGKWTMKRTICGPLEISTHLRFVMWRSLQPNWSELRHEWEVTKGKLKSKTATLEELGY